MDINQERRYPSILLRPPHPLRLPHHSIPMRVLRRHPNQGVSTRSSTVPGIYVHARGNIMIECSETSGTQRSMFPCNSRGGIVVIHYYRRLLPRLSILLLRNCLLSCSYKHVLPASREPTMQKCYSRINSSAITFF